MSGLLVSDPTPALVNRALFRLLGADMNSTADQLFTQLGNFTRYSISQIMATNPSGAISVAAGGVYTAPGKTGTTLVSAAQTYAALTGVNKQLQLTLQSAAQDRMSGLNLYLSLTTPMGSAATADFYIYGYAYN